jgi:antitoxin (DNA-binding transcriptional repressor) of toxin-antitoxin stability system
MHQQIFLPTVTGFNMAIFNFNMDISITKFKHSCLEVIRRLEKTGQPVAITRRGKVVARLSPSAQTQADARLKPWEVLQQLGGELRAKPGESVLKDEDFEALR